MGEHWKIPADFCLCTRLLHSGISLGLCSVGTCHALQLRIMSSAWHWRSISLVCLASVCVPKMFLVLFLVPETMYNTLVSLLSIIFSFLKNTCKRRGQLFRYLIIFWFSKGAMSTTKLWISVFPPSNKSGSRQLTVEIPCQSAVQCGEHGMRKQMPLCHQRLHGSLNKHL